MQYIELVERSLTNRGRVIPVADLKTFDAKYERYISHYRFNEEFVKFVKETKSTADFKGPVAIENIWVDFDKEDDVEGAKEETIKFVNYISEMAKVSPSTFPVFFSGNKGFHVGINATMLNINNQFSVGLPDKIRNFIEKLTNNIDFVDYKIYNKNRVIRLPYSLNKKSGLYKIYVPFDMLIHSEIDDIKDCAKECKRFPIKSEKAVFVPKFADIFNSTILRKPTENKPIEKTSSSIFKIPENGSRNDTLNKQAFRLYGSGLRPDEVSDIMHLIYRLTKAEKGDDYTYKEFINTLDSALKGATRNKLGDISIRPIDNLTYSVIDSIKKSRYIKTGYDDIDEDLEGGLKMGNVYSIIGKGGTKKSLAAMWIALKNCMNRDIPVAYFNMEMSTEQSFVRAFKMIFNVDFKERIRDDNLTEQHMENMSKEFNKALKNMFYLIDNNNLMPKDMANVIDTIKNTYGHEIKLIIADSMNSMATIGNSEAFTAFEITKELKQLAKEKDCVVILINHATQACMKHIRDVSLYVRGGAKVIDNCDAYFCLSMCIDKENSTLIGEDKDYVYLNDKVYCRFVNKRESGNTIDKILNVESNLTLTATDDDPKQYELSYRERL